ncbi:MAG TPA: hypothetical protein VHO70_15275 [Chitinispirillaceae bacterium]|nr:hypothetical protein [Chitinispirillaceae bacterium]
MRRQNLLNAMAIVILVACMQANAQWVEVNGSSGVSGLVTQLQVNGSDIFAATPIGLFMSADTGNSWNAVNSWDTKSVSMFASFGANGHAIFASTGSGVIRSYDNGKNWSKFNAGLTSSMVEYFGGIGDVIIAINQDGVFRAIVNDTSWTLWKRINSAITSDSMTELITIKGNLFAGTSNGVYLSSDSGTTWSAINTGLTNLKVATMCLIGNTIFAATDSGLFRSTDNGTSWNTASSGVTGRVTVFTSNSNSIVARTVDGVFCSTDSGTSWIPADSGLTGISTKSSVYDLATCGNRIFAGTGMGIYIYNDIGHFWTPVKSGLNNLPVTALIASDTSIVAGTDHYGMFRSTDDGTNWIVTDTVFSNKYVQTLFRYGKYILAGCGTGMYRSSDDGNSWLAADSGIKNLNINCITANENFLFAGVSDSGVYISTDSGVTWTNANSGIERRIVMSLTASSGYIFAGTSFGVYRSADNGTTWTNVGSSNLRIPAIEVMKNTIYIGDDRVSLSRDSGTTWITASTPEFIGVNFLKAVGNSVFAGGNFGIFLLKENDTCWIDVSPDFLKGKGIVDAASFAIKGNYIYVGTAAPNFWPGTGRGIWRRSLSEFPVTIKAPTHKVQTQSNFRIVATGNNRSNATITFALPYREHVVISVYNLSGVVMQTVTNQDFESGSYTISWATRSLPAGSYLVKMKTPANSCAKMFTRYR